MKLKTMFTISAVVSIVMGVVFFFAEAVLGVAASDLAPSDLEYYLVRAISTLLIGMGVAAWMIRDSGPSLARDSVVVGLVVANLLAIVTNLIALITGPDTGMSWAGLVANTFLALGFFLTGWPGRSTE